VGSYPRIWFRYFSYARACEIDSISKPAKLTLHCSLLAQLSQLNVIASIKRGGIGDDLCG
jgi:hypothetical protein